MRAISDPKPSKYDGEDLHQTKQLFVNKNHKLAFVKLFLTQKTKNNHEKRLFYAFRNLFALILSVSQAKKRNKIIGFFRFADFCLSFWRAGICR